MIKIIQYQKNKIIKYSINLINMENQRNKLLLIIHSLTKLILKLIIIILGIILISVILESSTYIVLGYRVSSKFIMEKQLIMFQHQNNLTNTINLEWTAIRRGIALSTYAYYLLLHIEPYLHLV
jgi:hypothetical protein